MSRIINFFRRHIFETFLFAVILILCFRNYTPGTFLTGWDNLHPEFNILANLKRSIFSTWQEYQGLGLLAGMAHAADLVRQLILLPFTFFLPTNLIRYLWHFSMLFWGTFGLFHLVFFITKNKYSSFIAALFYLLNFGTVQYFYLPFDPYSTFWGFFPWLIYVLLQHLEKPSSSSLKKIIIINLLATPSFYVQTLFLVYIICISLIFLVHFLNHPKTSHLLNYLSIYLLFFLINSFWLLPNIFFTLTHISTTQNSMQNVMVTDQFVEQNQYRGNLQSFSLLQGQYFDIKNNLSTSPQYIMSAWHEHLFHLPVKLISYLFLIISILAIFSKNKYRKYFIFILFFGLIGFLCDTAPFNFINSLIRQIPLVNQIFRNSFTKLLVPTIFSISVLVGIALSHLKRINLFFIALLAILSWPSFLGNFISPKMRINIPSEYFQLFKYLNTISSSQRILNLPQYNYWGWEDYEWGLSGSGFLWYGIDQPITDRAFDVWDNHLENLYWQLHYSLISRNPQYFQNILTKYNISYILFDPNVFFSESFNSSKVNLENQKLIDEIPTLKLEKQFGDLKLYQVTPPKNGLVTFTSLPNLNIPSGFTHLDWAFTNYSHYQNNPQTQYNDTFPYTNLFSNHPQQITNISNDILSASSWTTCVSTNSKLISATNQENTSFYNCGDNLDLNQSYLIKVNFQNISGRPPLIKIFSLSDHRLIVDSRINNSNEDNYFIIPPIYPYDLGLGVNLSSLSLSSLPSVNQINQIEISPFNWQNISNIHLNNPPAASISEPANFQQYNQTLYKVTLNKINQSQLVLFQSFSLSWIAFYFDCKGNALCLPHFLPHYQINNWANGWDINGLNDKTVYIFFWPQLLEFLGFILLLWPLFLFLKPRNLFPHNP
ncbi:MAG: hypothetical protein WC503_04340 [Candidatus Shapirobacteria bacterium]